MARLVDDLLSLSRIELAAHQPPRERCDPAEAVSHALDRMRPTAAQSNVRLDGRHPCQPAAGHRATRTSCISCSST